MWTGPGQDPGGGSNPEPPTNQEPSQELSDLKDQFEQQQVLIAQLKEMLRKSEQTSVTQEKVDKYMNTLTKMNARAKKGKAKRDEVDKRDDSVNRKTLDTPAKEKINLLRQQMEENKLILAERDKSQKGIEEMVIQLKAQLDDSQQLINQSSLNLSLLETKTEYNVNNSSEELYDILLAKEKRITELVNKVQKLETNNLDLQENLKEKDSVIDARTKAITLMTESLSRKGKTTLDTLDDTKEQMRKMQENFVEMEADMKARQLKLLEDLKQKNYEIADLQQTNSILAQDKDELENKIKEIQFEINKNQLEQNLEESEKKNLKLKEQLETQIVENQKLNDELNIKNDSSENEEMLKLKKQLDESNKNMIKVKAQHKSKIKELNKKIESFKNMNDSNAEIVKLESENCKLNQRIAELEEEKGSLQLNLVESDTKKDSGAEVDQGTNIKDYSKLLEEKEEAIVSLQNELISLKSENELLTEKLTNLSRLQNEKVTSEMKSIQFEEQMDLLENEKKQLIDEKNLINKENEELLEKLENLKKDKQEINQKLEHYIQENIELIDKLEKLSAEKVSSAESIEIVENLTQQEKLELEAYQKNLDNITIDNNLNKSDDNLQTNTELNESVNELTEETSELLKKIELFTVERREVMEKMELLSQENNQLNYKIKEIENNRDTLIETYEQLQNDKENIQKENDELKEQLQSSNKQIKEVTTNEVNQELKQLMELKSTLEINLNEANEEIKSLQEKVERNNGEINKFKLLIENYEKEIKESNTSKEELENKLENYEKNVLEFEETIIELNNNIVDLNRGKSNFENEKINYEIKLNELNNKISELNQKIEENDEIFEIKDNEILKLIKERDNLQNVVDNLHETIKEKDLSFHKFNTEIKEKYLILQKQLNDNSNDLEVIKKPLELKINELTNKNKEQLEKMKKIAANLKKKTQAYQELELEFNNNQLMYENLIKEKELLINENDDKIKSLLQQLNELENEVEILRNQKNVEYNNLLKDFELFKENKFEEIKQFESKNVELQNIIIELKLKLDKVNEMNLQQELMQTKEIVVENTDNVVLASKIQELELIVETQELELLCSKERINKLEESISIAEERRINLEKQANLLDVQLKEKSLSCEEITQSEELLENKLIELTKYDETIEKKLQLLTNENNELIQNNQQLIDENEKLTKKLNLTFEQINELNKNETLLDELELENTNLKKHVINLDNEIKQLKLNYDEILLNNERDLEKFQQQFNDLMNEKNNFEKLCEQLQEELKDIFEQNNNLNDELNYYKIKLEKSDCEIDEFNKLIDKNIEIKNYEKLIKEKDLEIENYRQQNLQLQMQNSFTTTTTTNIELFDDKKSNSNQQLIEELELKKNEIINLNEMIEKFKQRINELEIELLNKTSEKVEEKIIKEEIMPTFNWNTQEMINASSNNNNDELLNKIKTLEFMLFNAEKERDDALLQCHQLTNELTELIYERENNSLKVSNNKELESQILTVDTSDNKCKNILENLEFEQINPTAIIDSNQPVIEEIISPKEAYLCYKPPEDDNKSKIEKLENLESQILINDDNKNKSELVKLEFEPIKQFVENTKPIKEDECKSRQAYKCYDSEQVDLLSKDVFGGSGGENDDGDGWGWGPDATKLDLIDLENSNTLQKQLEQLEHKNRVLELERNNHLDEIKNLQIKSGKLIKKFKEIKQKYDDLVNKTNNSKSNDNDFFNLDNTIQEEFKLQIDKLEKKLKEITKELEKEKNEKLAILKRNDVLIAANERLVEMKEKQDVEVLSLQRIQKELNTKLEQYEWGDDGFASSTKKETTNPQITSENDFVELNKKIKECEEMIKDLTIDNEELQLLLEEQRTLRINAEKLNKSVPEPSIEPINTQTNYLDLLNERNNLNEKINLINDEKKQLQSEINNLIKKSDEQLELFNEIDREKISLNQLIIEKDKIIENLNETLIKIQNENFKLLETIDKNNFEINEMKHRIDLMENEKLELSKEFNDFKSNHLLIEKDFIDNYKLQINKLIEEKEELFNELNERNSKIDSLNESIETQICSLKKQLTEQTQRAEELFNTLNERNEQLEKLQNDNEITIENLTKEWELRVDQRGNDIAESWKLHLELKENEFLQTKESLHKEFNEKLNNLINENSELRKNVDLEIQNEVDRITELQQQISERQQIINKLELDLKEKLNEIDNFKQKIEQINHLETELEKKNVRLNELNIVVDLTQKQFKDEREIVEEVAKKLEDYLKGPVSFEKDDIVNKLNEIIKQLVNKEEEITKIQQQLLLTSNNLDEFHKKEELLLNDLALIKNENEKLQKSFNDKSDELTNLRSELQHIQNLKDYENENVQNLQQNLQDYQQLYLNLNTQLTEKNSQYEILLNEQNQLQELMQVKDVEIIKFKLLINEKENEYSLLLENITKDNKNLMNEKDKEIELFKQRLNEIENYYNDLLIKKDLNIEELQQQLDEYINKTKESNNLIKENDEINNKKLNEKIQECTDLEIKINEQNILIEEENKQLNELRGIIEEQVMKIEHLKTELYDKSNDYDSLIAQMDIIRTTTKPIANDDNKLPEITEHKEEERIVRDEEEDDLSEPVRRAELDLALYMLHQRDVRCEELTVELTQLLEERDTLQLRLSNALREKEEIGNKLLKDNNDKLVTKTNITGAIPKSKTSAIILESTGTELATEADEYLTTKSSEQLANKLSELKTIGYRKDKTIVDEQELRRFQELSIMQQHRDVASKLPPEAAARLVDASYTLSRDVQSPSKVLLNWLWGRSTPKVNNI